MGLVAPRHVGSSQARDPACVIRIGRRILCHRASRDSFLSVSWDDLWIFISVSAFNLLLLNGSVQFSRSVMSNSLWSHGLQHASLSCSSPTPRAYSNSWVGDAIQPPHPWSSPSPPLIFPSIRVFSNESVLHIRWPKYWNFSFNISPSIEHSRLISFSMDWLDLLQSKGLLRVFSNTTVQKHQFFGAQLSLWSNSHIHTWPLEKP